MYYFKSYYSGSSGNFNTLYDEATTIALDFGVPIKKAQKAMNFKLSRLDGILCSHIHSDHSKGLKDAIKMGIPVYTTQSVIDHTGISGHRVNEIKPGEKFIVGSFNILPFELEHDVPNVGFLIQNAKGEKAVYITDTAYCKFKFNGISLYVIEANYSEDILNENIKNGSIHPSVIKRLKKSHFELSRVKEFFEANDLSKAKQIHLIHLSDSNSDEKLFKREIQKICGIPVFVH